MVPLSLLAWVFCPHARRWTAALLRSQLRRLRQHSTRRYGSLRLTVPRSQVWLHRVATLPAPEETVQDIAVLQKQLFLRLQKFLVVVLLCMSFLCLLALFSRAQRSTIVGETVRDDAAVVS